MVVKIGFMKHGVMNFVYTLCLKKVSTFKLSVTLSNLQQFLKNFALLESIWNLLQNSYDTAHLNLGMLL